MSSRHSELGDDSVEGRAIREIHEPAEARLESLDDIPREIASRRLQAEFGEHLDPERSRLVREIPNLTEGREDFENAARAAGISETGGLQGFATRPEDPAHVLRLEDVAERIATDGHESLHRHTHPETLEDASRDQALRDFYEGVTEYLNQRAMEGLHGLRPGEVYPEQVEVARRVAGEVGEQPLREWFFKHELSDELRRALERHGLPHEQGR